MNGSFTAGPQKEPNGRCNGLLCIYVMTIMTLVVNSSITKLSQKRRTKKEKYFSRAAIFCFLSGEGATIVSLWAATRPKIIEPNEPGARQHSIGRLRAGVGCSLTAKFVRNDMICRRNHRVAARKKTTIIRPNLVKAFIQVQIIVIFSLVFCVSKGFFGKTIESLHLRHLWTPNELRFAFRADEET